MKKILVLFLFAVSFIGCSTGGDDPDPTPIPVVNKEPNAPTLSSPTNNMLCINNAVAFTWNPATDPDGDAISYTIEVSKDNAFTQIEHSLSSSSTSKNISLEKGKQYYWRVKSVDSKNASSSWSSIFQFQTEGVGLTNHLPFLPSLVAPQIDTTITSSSVSLKWQASDVDTSDVLSYDVYFGTDANPTNKIASDQSAQSLSVNLETSKTYYWKVVVKDGHGGQSTGPVWSFKTD
jgi:hypothetical protein